jgi:hypothetical protein
MIASHGVALGRRCAERLASSPNRVRNEKTHHANKKEKGKRKTAFLDEKKSFHTHSHIIVITIIPPVSASCGIAQAGRAP